MSFISTKKLLVILSILLVIAFTFWGFSRFALVGRKAENKQSGEIQLVSRDNLNDSYIVKEGDDLESIAELFGLSKETIIFANELETDGVLSSGQKLLIPAADGVFVVVKENDSLETLAKEYDVESQDIADFNWLDYPFSLEVGTTIFIPLEF
jgi:LysM repeat protein